MTFNQPTGRRGLFPSGRFQPIKMLAEWRRTTGEKAFYESNADERAATMLLRKRLIAEEFKEVIDEIDLFLQGSPVASLENLAKEMADLHYVLYGTEETLSIPAEETFKEVHRSNMTKFPAPAHPTIPGKFGKGPNYRPADIHGVLTGEWL